MKHLDVAYRDKKVFITGHTGFKGTWLTKTLQILGAEVVGFAIDPYISTLAPLEISGSSVRSIAGDIRELETLSKAIAEAQPDFVFHLAAQALVGKSYEAPVETFSTNVIGTVHLLEAVRRLDKPCSLVVITSDKVYRNNEWVWGYKETDQLGGYDPYSASKAAAELAISSYASSLFDDRPSHLAIARAGNVIGGGDWAINRIVPDCARSWRAGTPVSLRNAAAIRPWQHVLEPIRGYLELGSELSKNSMLHGEAFNFGPQPAECRTVGELVQSLSKYWPGFTFETETAVSIGHETNLLKLNCEKSAAILKWTPQLNFADTIKITAEWHQIHKTSKDATDPSYQQITEYMDLFN
jgi:CDP-glucose 4,6-dehydratase